MAATDPDQGHLPAGRPTSRRVRYQAPLAYVPALCGASGAFGDVDHAADPAALVGYLDTLRRERSVQVYKRRTYDQLAVHWGDHVLDVGCGTGDDARTLARQSGPTGHVVALDSSEVMIAEARRRAEPYAVAAPTDYVLGDAHRLEFPDNTFHAARADWVFQHLAKPKQALDELIRVVRPGGRVVLSDPDWETLVLDVAERMTTRVILDTYRDRLQNAWMGRQLPVLFWDSALTGVVVSAETLWTRDVAVADQMFQLRRGLGVARDEGTVSPEQAEAWLAGLAVAARHARFFAALTVFVVAGRKP